MSNLELLKKYPSFGRNLTILGLIFIGVTIFGLACYTWVIPFFGYLISIGFVLSTLGLLIFTIQQSVKSMVAFWTYFFLLTLILVVFLGITAILSNKLDLESMKKILEIFITVNIAILSVIFAVLAINPKDIINRLKKDSPSNLRSLKIFILLIPFSLLFTIFVYIMCSLNIDLFTLSVLFWIATFFIFILICNLMFYTWKITDDLLNYSEK